MALFAGPDVHFDGRYYQLDGVTVEPHLDPLPPVWVAGGSQLPHEQSPERPEMHPNVLRRIAESDGWIARTTAPPELIASDLALIQEARREAGETKPFTIAQENFVWIEEGGDRDAVIAEQQRRFAGVVSAERPWDYLDVGLHRRHGRRDPAANPDPGRHGHRVHDAPHPDPGPGAARPVRDVTFVEPFGTRVVSR